MTLKEFLKLKPEEQALEAAKCFPDIPSPPIIDWNTAKRLQGECFSKEFWHSMEDIWAVVADDNKPNPWNWAIDTDQPIHYIAAAMAAKNYFDKETK